MADAKITALTANTAPLTTDILPMVDDPAGTALTQKITFADVGLLLANPPSNDGDALGSTSLGWSDLFVASGAVYNHNSGSTTMTGGTNIFTFGGSGANGNGIVLPAGGTSIAPLKMTSGPALSGLGTAGAVEYDGTCYYTTPVTSARGVSPSIMYSIVPAANFSLLTTSGVQSCFPTTGDVWTLAGNTTYYMNGLYHITHTTTSVTVAMAFAAGGSVTSILYCARSHIGALNAAAAVTASSEQIVSTIATTIVTITSTANFTIQFEGIIRTNAAGTITPQINFSAATTVPVMVANSFIMFRPLGSDTNNILGNVA